MNSWGTRWGGSGFAHLSYDFESKGVGSMGDGRRTGRSVVPATDCDRTASCNSHSNSVGAHSYSAYCNPTSYNVHSTTAYSDASGAHTDIHGWSRSRRIHSCPAERSESVSRSR